MNHILALLRHLPGFKDSGHPTRKVLAAIGYLITILFAISLPFAPPSFTLDQNQLTTDSSAIRINGRVSDPNSEILIIKSGETIVKVKPDPQTREFFYDFSSLPPGTHTYSSMVCFLDNPDNCSPKQEITIIANLTTDAPQPTDTPPASTASPTLTVANVIDGDTIKMSDGKVVRLIGIDTPEIGSNNDCFGREASAKATELLLNQAVTLEKDVSETDRYGRLLRYVWKGSELINETLVLMGYAKPSTYPPDVKYQSRFLAAQQQAVRSDAGLWSACKPTPTPNKVSILPFVAPQPSPAPNSDQTDTYICNCSKTCANLSCAEAQYQLSQCGCKARDGDGDGIACDSNCQ